ncbi:MAG: hypothetical protein L6371_00685 [Candidatus Atribacteria bacterium]|nr:hypothetical protein [Candidatus Atribacteria bacterium]
MKGNEKQVLKIVTELKDAKSESIAQKIGISKEYTSKICQNLVGDGYLEEINSGNFRLTLKGKKSISPIKTIGPIPILKGGN